jgi:hypothetical protein
MQNHVVVIQKRYSVDVWLGTSACGCPTTGHGTAPSLSIMVSEWQMYE